jgi:hypothetical protein
METPRVIKKNGRKVELEAEKPVNRKYPIKKTEHGKQEVEIPEVKFNHKTGPLMQKLKNKIYYEQNKKHKIVASSTRYKKNRVRLNKQKRGKYWFSHLSKQDQDNHLAYLQTKKVNCQSNFKID